MQLSSIDDSEEWAALEAELDAITDLPELDELLDNSELDEYLAMQFDSPAFQELDEILDSMEFDSLLPTDEEMASLLDFDLQDDDFTVELDNPQIEQGEI